LTDPWFKTAFGLQYPLLYRHRDQAEALKCLNLLLRLAPLELKGTNQDRILDLGCGDGRHLHALSKENCQIIGLDFSSPLLLLASAKMNDLESAHLVQGDMGCLPFRANMFLATFSLFTAFGYFGPLASNGHVLQEISRTLAPGGIWFFDYFDCDRVTRELGNGKPKIRIREEGPLHIREVRSLNSRGDQVCKNVVMTPRPGMESQALKWGVTADGLNYTEEVAVFSKNQIEELAAKNHLAPIASAGSYDGVPLGEGDRWLMIFRKTNS